ncbi:family 16 glycosylhydrolase [Cerasicoccus fimbriatus]|uniref:family 16 glycosylhydrolase n=1 Tax=Cerasicoccus fimbriatus TaxID=3014554 RepID=UPI0022B2F370|nr:family 16 glycosylhydrolase [Cerasicoccus sp. TK19100]
MRKLNALLLLAFSISGLNSHAADTQEILDLDSPTITESIKPSSSQVTVEESTNASEPGVIMTVTPGSENYPGIEFQPTTGTSWDLSNYGHVAVTVTNIGKESMSVSLRVDNAYEAGSSPWNTENTYLKEGQTKTIKVIFGYANGNKPSYKLDPAKITRILVFTGKVKDERKLLIQSLVAGGPSGEKPPVDPSKIKVAPQNGYILGQGIPLDVDKQVKVDGDVHVRPSPEDKHALQIAFSDKGQYAKVSPPQGKWRLIDGNQVVFKVRNMGSSSVSPTIKLDSEKGPTSGSQPKSPIAPGETGEIIVSFIPETPWRGITGSSKTNWDGEKGTGTRFASDKVKNFIVSADAQGGKQVIEIISAKLDAPSIQLPEWVGKRPPVEGDWKLTFEEEFKGDTIDLTKWNIYTENYWDKRTHFSKDNVIIEDGTAILRYEKKRGHHNDDPNGKVTDYASGFLDTYGKWVQRYGYFEARMKLPTAPGVWPALWLMPDRGIDEGPQWKRADTGRGGMEFDIMEYLSGWGPYRYNIAFHWDGYGKDHKQTGTEQIYVAHDEDGYITTGLLWLPGYAAIYNNGRLVAEWETTRISDVPADIMFTHVSGGWANVPLQDEPLPDDFVIDYVRAWQRADLASDVDGVKSTQTTPAAPTTKD